MFVYGTLMPGDSRWSALEPFAERWEDATAPGQLWDTGRGYPAATFVGDQLIPGVIVWVTGDRWDEAIRTLDEIEGEGSLYRRVEVNTSRGLATTYEWLLTTEGLRPLRDWRAQRN